MDAVKKKKKKPPLCVHDHTHPLGVVVDTVGVCMLACPDFNDWVTHQPINVVPILPFEENSSGLTAR